MVWCALYFIICDCKCFQCYLMNKHCHVCRDIESEIWQRILVSWYWLLSKEEKCKRTELYRHLYSTALCVSQFSSHIIYFEHKWIKEVKMHQFKHLVVAVMVVLINLSKTHLQVLIFNPGCELEWTHCGLWYYSSKLRWSLKIKYVLINMISLSFFFFFTLQTTLTHYF